MNRLILKKNNKTSKLYAKSTIKANSRQTKKTKVEKNNIKIFN